MRVLTIANYKGGVAKTTTVVNVSYNLTLQGYRVLVIDADPQGNLSYFYNKQNPAKKSFYDVLMGYYPIKSAIRRTKFKNLDILPGNNRTEELTNIREFTLRDKLTDVSHDYDFVIIDCQPSMQINTINAMVAADDIIIPVKLSRYGINGLELMDKYISDAKQYNPNISFKGCLITLYHSTKCSNNGIQELLEKTTYPIFDTVISRNSAADTSIECRKPLICHRSKASVTKDYEAFTKEYLEMVVTIHG